MVKELDPIAVKLVALDGHQLALKKLDRLEAIKLMIEHNVPRQIMAWRLCINVLALERYTKNHNIKLPPTVPPAHWSVDYIDARSPESRRVATRERARRRRERESEDA